jgi:hypothetical protein
MEIDWAQVVTLVVGTVVGAVGTLLGTVVQQRHARKEREAAARERREERAEQRLLAEREKVGAIYVRMSRIAREYRALEESADPGVRWKEFSPRLYEVQAELDIHGGPKVRKAFVDYLDHVQKRQAEADRIGDQSEFWLHHDEAMEGLLNAMEEDWGARFVSSPELDRGAQRSEQAQLPPPSRKHLPPGGDS